jgi:hypothetical protein
MFGGMVIVCLLWEAGLMKQVLNQTQLLLASVQPHLTAHI